MNDEAVNRFEVGERFLVDYGIGVVSATVKEVSPSGNWVLFDKGNWVCAKTLRYVERLARKPPIAGGGVWRFFGSRLT